MTTTVARSSRAPRTIVLAAAGVAVSAAATAIIAVAALAAGADPAFPPLAPGPYLTFSIAGFLLALVGWMLVARRPGSARVLRVLVPVLVVASFVPDVLVLAFDLIPGASLTGVVALMIMHLPVAAAAVGVGSAITPAR